MAGLDITTEADIIRSVIIDLKRITGLSWIKFCDLFKGTHHQIENFCKGNSQSLHSIEIGRINLYIDNTVDIHTKKFLISKYRKIFINKIPVDHNVDDVIKQWFEISKDLSDKNSKHWTDSNNRNYLVIRRYGMSEDDGGIVVSRMKIIPSQDGSGVWGYETQRPATKDNIEKITKGNIFNINGRIFALGVSNQLWKIRLSSLEIKQRGLYLDMFGLRLGISHKNDIFAHKVYAYNLQHDINKYDYKALAGVFKKDNYNFLREKIKDFDFINEKLYIGSTYDNGVRAKL